MLTFLKRLVPRDGDYLHNLAPIDGRDNAHSHLIGLFMNSSETIPVAGGAMVLGEWQSIFFIELDGPRERRGVELQIIGRGLRHRSQAGRRHAAAAAPRRGEAAIRSKGRASLRWIRGSSPRMTASTIQRNELMTPDDIAGFYAKRADARPRRLHRARFRFRMRRRSARGGGASVQRAIHRAVAPGRRRRGFPAALRRQGAGAVRRAAADRASASRSSARCAARCTPAASRSRIRTAISARRFPTCCRRCAARGCSSRPASR